MSEAHDQNSLDAETDVSGFSAAAVQSDLTGSSISLCVPTIPLVTGYEVIRELGRGGMGVVYLARDEAMDRLVAIKTFIAECSDEWTSLLTAEARISGKLNHPAIVPVFEVNSHCALPYFSMAFVEGENLSQRIARQVLSPSDAAELGVTIADALAHAHQQGVAHLDIKPANILLDNTGHVKITDFGLFALISSPHLREGAVGTPQFMAPEQAIEDHEAIGQQSDIYSIGAVLYAAIAGRPPLVASNPSELLLRVASMRPKSLSSFAPRVPMALDAIIMKCLEKSPKQRYQTAEELKCDLVAFLNGRPVAARPHGIVQRLRYQFRQHVLAASVSGSLVLLLLILSLVSVVFQAVENHYEVARLENEVAALERLQVQLRRSFEKSIAGEQGSAVDVDTIADVAQLARDLSEQGDARRAAIFASDAFVSALQSGLAPSPDLESLIRGYRDEWRDSNSIPISDMANAIRNENVYTDAAAAD